MEVIDAIYHRRSVRSFTSEPVSDDRLTWLINAAVHAPSAVNEQPWHFTVIRNAHLLDEISRRAKAHMLAAPSDSSTNPHFRGMLEDQNFQLFYHAPALIVISAISRSEWAVEDCALAAATLMLAACSAGLGCCWIGFAQRWLATAEGKAMVGLPDGYLPVAPIIVGHPSEASKLVPRNAARVHWMGTFSAVEYDDATK